MGKELQVGDVVMLNSGSPLMTVEVISPSGENVRCRWFFDEYIAEPEWFKTATLTSISVNSIDFARLTR